MGLTREAHPFNLSSPGPWPGARDGCPAPTASCAQEASPRSPCRKHRWWSPHEYFWALGPTDDSRVPQTLPPSNRARPRSFCLGSDINGPALGDRRCKLNANSAAAEKMCWRQVRRCRLAGAGQACPSRQHIAWKGIMRLCAASSRGWWGAATGPEIFLGPGRSPRWHCRSQRDGGTGAANCAALGRCGRIRAPACRPGPAPRSPSHNS